MMILIPILSDTILFDPQQWGQADDNRENYIKTKAKWPPKKALPDTYTLLGDPCITANLRNQGSCGNCWAAATAATIGMRRCLKLNDKSQISIQELTSCDHTSMYGVTDNGCWGGHPLVAMQYGYTTGQTYEPCYKYKYLSVTYPYPATTCQIACDDGTTKKRLMNGPPVRLSTETSIMQEIFTNGPVAVAFQVYSDFSTTTKNDGILLCPGPKLIGGHAVILIGWGVRNGVKYWQAQNTYGPNWNNGGYFKIRRGQNDCMIESQAAAATVIGTTPVVETGTFVFQNTWIGGQTVQIGYQNMQSCSLTVGSATVGTITGSGSINYLLPNVSGSQIIKCGNAQQTINVLAYKPAFTAAQFTGTTAGVQITFSTSGQSQTITIGTQVFTTTANFVNFVATAGTYTATLTTIATNPIITATAQVIITAPVATPTWSITVQPADITVNTPSTVSLAIQNVPNITMQLYSGTTLLNTQTKTDLLQQTTIQFTYTPTVTGQLQYKFQCGTLTLASNTFNVAAAQQQAITQPKTGQIIIQGGIVAIQTSGLNGVAATLNGAQIGTITNNAVQWNVNQPPGAYVLAIGTQQVQLQVIPKPKFDQATYTGDLTSKLTVTITSTPVFTFDKYVKVLYNNVAQTVVNNQFQLSATAAGTGTLTLAVDNAIPTVSESAQVQFGGQQTDTPIALTYPTPTTVLTAGQAVTIKWSTNQPATSTVAIVLYRGTPTSFTFVQTYSNAAPNTGSFDLTLPTTLPADNYYFTLRIIVNAARVVYNGQFLVK